MPSHSAESDPLGDFCIGDTNGPISGNSFPCKLASKAIPQDFFYEKLNLEANTNNILGSNVTKANVMVFPGLNTLGISMNRIDIASWGVNPPHYHPRAAESGMVIKGQVMVGLITTGNNVQYSKVLGVGEIYVVPKGVVHFQKNVGQEKALIYAAFNSHLARTVLAGVNLFCSRPYVDYEVMTRAFQVDKTVIDKIKNSFGYPQCNSFIQFVG
ncbi:hypothetical protein BUALT_Bualt02G0147300 [Buddleja alternifolia]|uniref:Germin-like protein n=1 Tax=Buddleja alternifolia TaxID=168488 RepID=A0AAV6Y0S9_9LAMI|nr:hypothetical protein BUALT_Bualt02G0147300 [Buddleja alternifolia]